MTSFDKAKEYVDKAEEYYEMAWQEWENGNWTAEEKKQFVSLLMKTLDQASHMDFRDKI